MFHNWNSEAIKNKFALLFSSNSPAFYMASCYLRANLELPEIITQKGALFYQNSPDIEFFVKENTFGNSEAVLYFSYGEQ